LASERAAAFCHLSTTHERRYKLLSLFKQLPENSLKFELQQADASPQGGSIETLTWKPAGGIQDERVKGWSTLFGGPLSRAVAAGCKISDVEKICQDLGTNCKQSRF
jgi:hypothetical protein